MIRRAAIAAFFLLAAGCSEDRTVVPSTSVARTWIGTYAGATGYGSVAIDLVQTGGALGGEVVIGPRDAWHFYVQGTLHGDSLQLALDPTHGPYQFTFALGGRVRADGGLDARLLLPFKNLDATLDCRALPRRTATVDLSIDVPYTVLAMAYDGVHLWLSTSGDDYIRLTPDGAVVDRVVVYYWPGAHWTSDAVAAEGALLWGYLPGNEISPTGSRQYADVVGFNVAGRTADSLRLWYRPAGLTFDGATLWSMRAEDRKLISFTHTGTLTDSLDPGIPDATQLVYQGSAPSGRFWTLGWYMKRLYEVDGSGTVVALSDIPGENTGSMQAGLAAQGQHVWVAEGHIGYTTLHRLTMP